MRAFLKLLLDLTVNLLNCASITGIFSLASTGIQQGDPLSPFLFSLALVQFFDSTPLDEACLLSLSFYDDGTFICFRSSLHTLLPFTLYQTLWNTRFDKYL